MSEDDRSVRGALPPEWARLERAADETSAVIRRWVRRAGEAEEEIERLRQALDDLTGERTDSDDLATTVKRLRAENAALRSRMLQARKRVAGLMQRLAAIEGHR